MVPVIDDAVGRRRLTTADGRAAWLLESAEAPAGMAGTLRQADGACVFHRPRAGASMASSASRECAVHATLGHAALPSTCQHFPRVALVDDRGVRVSLSHVCPTALDLLVSYEGPVTIVPGPPAVPGREVPEGLDARGELPPALSERVLMDLETLTLWEAHAVDALAGPRAMDAAAEDVVAMLRQQASALAEWTPRRGALADTARGILARPRAIAAASFARDASMQTHARVAATCRPPWTWAPAPVDLLALDSRWVAGRWRGLAPLVRRYLATRAFGAWAQYQAGGLGGSASWLGTVLGVLRVEAVRAAAAAQRPLDDALLGQAIGQADLLLLHYAGAADAARAFSADDWSVHDTGPCGDARARGDR